MTTDTVAKEVAVRFLLDGHECRMGAISKGSGMIHPNMATMLCFVTTDAAIAPACLQAALSAVVTDTFNMLSIDGDTSTNDMVSVLANGMALAGHFGSGTVSAHDLAAGLQGAVVKDEEKDKVVWAEYLANILKKRGAEWRPLFTACTEHNGG